MKRIATTLALGTLLFAAEAGQVATEAEALQWLRTSAEAGNPGAQNTLGRTHFLRDNAKALGWFSRAAEQGHAEAQYWLAMMHERGLGTRKDYRAAFQWFLRSAEQGFPRAEAMVGYMYRQGEGVRADQAEALRWYRRAAEHGNPDAQNNLGRILIDKQTRKADEEAYAWAKKAAEQGHVGAQKALSIMYASGLGVPVDLDQATLWQLRAGGAGPDNEELLLEARVARAVAAMEAGDQDATHRLGDMFFRGDGVEQDNAMALRLWVLAAP